MIRKISIVLFLSLFFTVSTFAEINFSGLDIKIPVFKSVTFFAVEVDDEELAIPESIANNQFYIQSLRASRLAMEMYEFGDYDASANFAREAIRFAYLSDEYVSNQLIVEAGRLKTWADNNNVAARFPNNYREGVEQYEAALAFHMEDEWGDSIVSSIKAIEIFAAFAGNQVTSDTRTAAAASATGLPRQYTVRTWRVERDCLWNIAGYPWVYGDPWRWRELYEANKSKLPDPNNPDLIEPGMVLDIPNRPGETRQGMWQPNSAAGTQNGNPPVLRVRP